MDNVETLIFLFAIVLVFVAILAVVGSGVTIFGRWEVKNLCAPLPASP